MKQITLAQTTALIEKALEMKGKADTLDSMTIDQIKLIRDVVQIAVNSAE